MRAIICLAVASVASAATMQEIVDILFDKYLPEKATWEKVKACRTTCNHDKGCLATCPKYECPFHRVSAQCNLVNSSVAAFKACHHTCEHDSACHFKKCLPLVMPTSMKELKGLADHVLCSKACGNDKPCHKTCPKHWEEKLARCEKLEAVVTCMKDGGSHSTCPHLDKETKMELMREPWSLPKDIVEHVAEHLLPLCKGQEVAVEDVKACHMRCGHDFACHKNCPTGVFGRFKDQCAILDEASVCHQACEKLETKCPFKKTECHFKCPVSMPTSLKEFRGLTDHVLCHTTCGQDKLCHKACPNSIWAEKKAHCMKYHEMMACHKSCGNSHSCHANCPHLTDEMLNEVQKKPSNFAKDVNEVLLV